jgi:hypothetical protein
MDATCTPNHTQMRPKGAKLMNHNEVATKNDVVVRMTAVAVAHTVAVGPAAPEPGLTTRSRGN